MIRGAGDVVYVLGIDPKAGDYWYIYRPAGAIVSLDGKEVLGYESRFLGTARVEKFGDLATVRIESAVEEILVGDRMLPAPRETLVNYVPHAPDKPVNARILRVPFGGLETGRGGIVTLDQGTADGMEVGHVLAIYRVVDPIEDPRPSRQQTIILRFLDPTTVFTPKEYVAPADERTGLLFVFRTFDRVSFAVVLNTTDPVRPGDYARASRSAALGHRLVRWSDGPPRRGPSIVAPWIPPPRTAKPGPRCRCARCRRPRSSRCCARSAARRRSSPPPARSCPRWCPTRSSRGWPPRSPPTRSPARTRGSPSPATT